MIEVNWTEALYIADKSLQIFSLEMKYGFIGRFTINRIVKWREKRLDKIMKLCGFPDNKLNKLNTLEDIKERFNRKREIAKREIEIEKLTTPKEKLKEEEKHRNNFQESLEIIKPLFIERNTISFYNFFSEIAKYFNEHGLKIKNIILEDISKTGDKFIKFKKQIDDSIDLIDLLQSIDALFDIIDELEKSTEETKVGIKEIGWSIKLKKMFDELENKYKKFAEELEKIQKKLNAKHKKDFKQLLYGFI